MIENLAINLINEIIANISTNPILAILVLIGIVFVINAFGLILFSKGE